MDVSPLWAILFFFMLILLGIDSEFAALEAAIVPLNDMSIFRKIRREYFTGMYLSLRLVRARGGN